MKLLSRLSWGIVIYAIVYVFSQGLLIYGFSTGLVPLLCRLVVLIIIATVAGRSLKFHSWKDILPYSFFWACTVAGLDAVLTLPFGGTAMYASPNLWIGYALVMLLPLAAPQTRVLHDDTAAAL